MRSRSVTNKIFLEKIFYLYACATCSELPSNTSTMALRKLGVVLCKKMPNNENICRPLCQLPNGASNSVLLGIIRGLY